MWPRPSAGGGRGPRERCLAAAARGRWPARGAAAWPATTEREEDAPRPTATGLRRRVHTAHPHTPWRAQADGTQNGPSSRQAEEAAGAPNKSSRTPPWPGPTPSPAGYAKMTSTRTLATSTITRRRCTAITAAPPTCPPAARPAPTSTRERWGASSSDATGGQTAASSARRGKTTLQIVTTKPVDYDLLQRLTDADVDLDERDVHMHGQQRYSRNPAMAAAYDEDVRASISFAAGAEPPSATTWSARLARRRDGALLRTHV